MTISEIGTRFDKLRNQTPSLIRRLTKKPYLSASSALMYGKCLYYATSHIELRIAPNKLMPSYISAIIRMYFPVEYSSLENLDLALAEFFMILVS